MSTNQNAGLLSRILFKIDAGRCELSVGNGVAPETTIGENPDTGEAVQAGCHGRLEGIQFCASDHTLIVVIQPLDH